MAGKLISDLNSVVNLGLADAMEIDKDVSGTRTSYKTTVKDIVQFANQNIADEYDSTSTYAVDDYVIYESVLYKCIGTTTGTFDSTKWTSVVVTDEMGSGGGGGTGGHTIIDENGTSMSARAGLQFVGGANVSDDPTNNKTIVDLASAGGIDGVFIDTGNVIQASATLTAGTEATYTATEDCVVDFLVYASNGNGYIKVNDVNIVTAIGSGFGLRNYLFVKKGQIIKMMSYGTNGSYTVYGIQTGTTHSKFQPVIYSTEEREIGVYKDGKPLYQKTLVVANVGSVGSSLVTPIEINDIPFDYIEVVEANIYDSNNNRRYTLPNLSKTANDRIFLHPYLDKSTNPVVFYASLYTGGTTYSNLSDLSVTIQYTKTTDTAGSGSWTPQGVPTHHYSTDEKVIGTWIDGSTIYGKTFVLENALTLSSNSWNNTPISNSGISKVIDVTVFSSQGAVFKQIAANRDSGNYVQILNSRDNNITINCIYLEYIKSS